MTAPAGDEEERPIAWTAITQDEEVVDEDGRRVGVVDEVLGTGEMGVFHGIVVRSGLFQDPFAVQAADIGSITNKRVSLKLGADAIADLPPYVEDESYTVGIVGLFRKRPGWMEEGRGSGV